MMKDTWGYPFPSLHRTNVGTIYKTDSKLETIAAPNVQKKKERKNMSSEESPKECSDNW